MRMQLPAGRLAGAALLALSGLLIPGAVACGNGGGAQQSPGPGGETRSPPPGAAGRLPQQIDLATGQFPRLLGRNGGDLTPGYNTLAFGDFNDDSRTDLLVGAPQGDGPEEDRPDAGEAYVILGPLDGDVDLNDADLTIYGGAAGDYLGYSVLAADINDDGVDDVVVGAPGVTAGFDPRTDQGRVYVFYGGDSLGENGRLDLAEDVFDFTLTGAEGFGRLGAALAAGDVDGDGAADLVAGAPFAGRKPGTPPGGERTAVGEVYIVFGGDLEGERNVARDEYDVLISGSEPFAQFGSALAVADINGDGLADIVAGAYRTAGGGDQPAASGIAYAFLGREEFPDRILVAEGGADTVFRGPGAAAAFGYPIVAGDFNGDGIADVAFGSQLEGGETPGNGALRIYFGRDGLPAEVATADESAVTITGRSPGELFPSALAAADLDGDGADDLLAGSLLADAEAPVQGAPGTPATERRAGSGLVYVFTALREGTVDLASGVPSSLILGAAAGERLGNAVAAATARGDDESSAFIAALAPNAVAGENRPGAGVAYIIPVGEGD